ncbi:integrase catalytic domain-containing protein [Trichonephila clavipes]|nr:integrase catalytic domain-containing protein [Trichonephila clavipes]
MEIQKSTTRGFQESKPKLSAGTPGRDLLEGMPIFGPARTPTAIPTKLGYILSGKIYAPPLKESIVNSSLNDQLLELWKLEEVPKTNAKIQIPDPCEESFSKSVKRNNEGRYIVNLPFKENNTLGESKEKAVQLLYALENKFHKNKQFKDNFLNFMNEYLALGHMREISQKRDDETPNCYIPYHMVINEKSTTTKCLSRVVFNASSKTKNGKSLNDVLMTGPKLQTEIFNHLIKFRSYRVAFIAADIEKMYRQILISDEDYKYQRIVWRATPSDSLKSFELQTITYGDEESKQRVLGLIWNLKTDSIQVKVVHEEIVKTKRQLLSVIAQIFDLLGLFSPSVITLKIMLQELWKSKAFWDDPIPSSILENWNKFTKESKYLNSISIPRFMGIDQNSDIILHGFCDASTKAYAAVVYLKSKQEIYIL